MVGATVKLEPSSFDEDGGEYWFIRNGDGFNVDHRENGADLLWGGNTDIKDFSLWDEYLRGRLLLW